ncbi:MAG: translocation/assembly module TamB domain-containing protein [Candidatus Omnitrophica bacterium]|nr:translocation/assembly module TamB domain-containing protein [Candidatus Omnitrophota bacterium]
MHRKNNLFLFIVTLLVFALICTAGYLVFYTAKGAESVGRFLLYYFTRSHKITIEKTEGTIHSEASLHNILITNPNKLPQGTVIQIQRLDLSMRKFKLRDMQISIYNGRLKLLFSDTILFYGDYNNMFLELELYSKRVSAREIIDLFTRRPVLSTLSGVFSDVSIHIAGTISALAAEGTFYIENIIKERFSIVDCQGSLLMYCDNLIEAARLNGEIVLQGGLVSGGKTALIRLGNSKIVFDKDPKRPKLNIRGSAKVEDVAISMVLQGTVDEPKLTLSSNPALTQELLLVMLATGRAWGSTRGSLQSGRISADLIKDFVDYFLLAGTGSKIARRFGISDISLFYRNETKTMGLSTSLTDKLKVGYEVEQPQEDENGEGNTTTHTVKGEVKITDTISVNAEKQLNQTETQQELEQEQQQLEEGEEKVYLKFKKKF